MADPSHPPNGHRPYRVTVWAALAVLAMILATVIVLAAMDKDPLAEKVLDKITMEDRI